jgi:hypothetical protein
MQDFIFGLFLGILAGHILTNLIWRWYCKSQCGIDFEESKDILATPGFYSNGFKKENYECGEEE